MKDQHDTQKKAKLEVDQRITETNKQIQKWKSVAQHFEGEKFFKDYIHQKYIIPLHMKLSVDISISHALGRAIHSFNH